MNTLNKKIKEQKLLILSRRLNELSLKESLERKKNTLKNQLDPKDKFYSNEEKREFYVCELPEIKKLIDELRVYKYDTDIMDAEYEYSLRELGILRVYELKGVDVFGD